MPGTTSELFCTPALRSLDDDNWNKHPLIDSSCSKAFTASRIGGLTDCPSRCLSKQHKVLKLSIDTTNHNQKERRKPNQRTKKHISRNQGTERPRKLFFYCLNSREFARWPSSWRSPGRPCTFAAWRRTSRRSSKAWTPLSSSPTSTSRTPSRRSGARDEMDLTRNLKLKLSSSSSKFQNLSQIGRTCCCYKAVTLV